MLDLKILLITSLGVVLSVILPILRSQLPNSEAQRSAKPFWDTIKPYLILGLFSILTSVLILAFIATENIDWRGALLAGYAWDSTLQKITETN